MFSLAAPLQKALGYKNSQMCCAALEGTEAIDYFFAIHTLQSISQAQFKDLSLQIQAASSQVLPIVNLAESSELLPSELASSEANSSTDSCEQQALALAFHLLLALSFFQRSGHSCIELKLIAGQGFWHATQDGKATGFVFAAYDALYACANWLSEYRANIGDIRLLDGRLYSQRYWQYEHEIAEYFAQQKSQALRTFDPTEIAYLQQLWPQLFAAYPKHIDAQQLAVLSALVHPCIVLSGGAGTGKTYTIARMTLACMAMQKHSRGYSKILFAAPTGKAAQRLNESLNRELSQLKAQPDLGDWVAHVAQQVSAQTVHRLLGFRPLQSEAKYHAKRPLDCDILVIDEASMIDLAMLCKIIRALPSHAKLILVGDANQLPSVETGNVLADLVRLHDSDFPHHAQQQTSQIAYTPAHCEALLQLLPELNLDKMQAAGVSLQNSHDHTTKHSNEESQKVHTYNLDHVSLLSQGKRATLHLNSFAASLIAGRSEEALAQLTQVSRAQLSAHGNDSISLYKPDYLANGQLPKEAIEHIAKQYVALLNCKSVHDAFSQLQQYRCLSPTRKGPTGTLLLNQQIEMAMARLCPQIIGKTVYPGKAIMITQNDYRLSLFNGDSCIIWPDDKGDLRAWFEANEPGEYISHALVSLPANESLYAMTIHKTQGSEFASVDVILPNKAAEFLSRELLYTGVTRAKQSLSIWSSATLLKQVIQQQNYRASGIAQQIKALLTDGKGH